MNIAEEKVFLYGMMKDITEERRRLTDMYFSLKERVDHLHKLEEKGIGELSTKGFIDLFNDRETQIQITNINRETQYAIERREKELQKPRYDKVAETLERGQADREAERLAKLAKAKAEADEQDLINTALFESQQVTMKLEEENKAKKGDQIQKEIVPKVLIEETKEREIKRGPGRPKKVKEEKVKKRQNSAIRLKEAVPLMIKVLKEHGAPMETKLLHQKLEEISGIEIPYKNFTSNIIYRAKKEEPRIQHIMPGFYQYNPSPRE